MFSWSDIFTPDAQTTAEADANYAAQKTRLQAQLDERNADPFYEPTIQDGLDRAALVGQLENKNAAAAAGFKEGLGDGLKNIKDSVTGFGLFKLVPIWVWIVAGIVVFFWIGGAAWSKGRLNR